MHASQPLLSWPCSQSKFRWPMLKSIDWWKFLIKIEMEKFLSGEIETDDKRDKWWPTVLIYCSEFLSADREYRRKQMLKKQAEISRLREMKREQRLARLEAEAAEEKLKKQEEVPKEMLLKIYHILMKAKRIWSLIPVAKRTFVWLILHLTSEQISGTHSYWWKMCHGCRKGLHCTVLYHMHIALVLLSGIISYPVLHGNTCWNPTCWTVFISIFVNCNKCFTKFITFFGMLCGVSSSYLVWHVCWTCTHIIQKWSLKGK